MAFVAPDASVRISYGIPTYEVGKKRLYVGAGSTACRCTAGVPAGMAGPSDRHPELKTGKGTIQLSEESAGPRCQTTTLDGRCSAVLGWWPD